MKALDSFTVERLEEFIRQPLENGLTRSEQMELARIALAAKRAEPVAYITYKGYLIHAGDPKLSEYSDPEPLYDAPQLNSPEIPEGWPTEDMVIAGFESGAWDALSSAVVKRQGWPYSCRESAECVTGIFKAMLAAAPEKENG
ncbi:hypothetical protein RSG04_002287 [Yersinia enterocolitica]|nr:hypothetical protein [Yersinia enterocolitica]